MRKESLRIARNIIRALIIVTSVTFGIAGYIKMDRDYDFNVSVLDQVGYSDRYVDPTGKIFEVVEYSPSGSITLAVNKSVGEMFLRDFYDYRIPSEGLEDKYGPMGDNIIIVSESNLLLFSIFGMIALIGFVFVFPIGTIIFWIREGQ